MLKTIKSLSAVVLIIFAMHNTAEADAIKKYNIGYFEAGQYDVHSILQDEYFKQLELMLPDSVQLISIPEGFRSAEWDRKKSKQMAAQLASQNNVDIMLAFGPWVVQDLLEAGFEKPIIGMHQFNPKAEGLLDDRDRPIAKNLTVHFRPGKTVDDILTLMKIQPLKKLGVLSFPSDDTSLSLDKHIASIGEQYGFEVVTATEYDNKGTFAFYKSYAKIRDARVDAIYLSPLWGLASDKVLQFFEMLNRERVMSFTDEGSLLIQSGATATNNYFGLVSEAYFNAYKTIEILNGATPSELPVVFRSGSHIALNKYSIEKCNIAMRSQLFNNYEIIEDKKTVETQVESLSELVHRGISQNPLILAQSDKIDALDASIGISKSAYKPQLTADAEFDYIDDNFQSNFHNYVKNEIFKSSLNLSQTIYSKEKLKSVQAVKELKKVEQKTHQIEKIDLERSLSLAYLENLQIKEESKVIQNLRNMVSYNIELLRAKQIADNTDSLSLLRLDMYRYNLTLAYIENHRSQKTAQINLNSLLNLPHSEPLFLDEIYFSENSFIEFESPIISKLQTHYSQDEIENRLLDKMLTQNISLSKADALINYNKALLEKSASSFFPEISLHSSLLYSDFQKETIYFQEKDFSWYVGGKISLPLFLGGKRHKEKQQTAALLSESEYQKDIVSLTTMKNGLTSFQNFTRFTEQMTPSYQAKQRAYSSLDIANRQYHQDKLSTTDFLAIIETTLETDLQFIQIRYNYYAAMADVVHALGINVSDSYSDFVIKFHDELEY